MKKISILIPCYNEIENVEAICNAVINEMEQSLPNYDYELLFIDNHSIDGTREKIETICAENRNVKAIFNIANFGQGNSPFYGMCQTTGDCTIVLCCDFQDPVDMIPKFVAEWENGYKIVSAIKTTSEENKLIYALRSVYYKMIRNMSNVRMIEHFTGFGLYDSSFINLLKQLDDPIPFLRGMVAEYGVNRKELSYMQKQRQGGKSKNNFYTLYDFAMLSVTSYTKVGLRLATLFGFLSSGICVAIAAIYFVLKLIHWNDFQAGYAPMIIGIFLLGSIQLFFIGFLGEYIMNINSRVMKRPLVIEERRINFTEEP